MERRVSKNTGVFKDMKVYSMRDGAFAITCVKLPSQSDEKFRLEILQIRSQLDTIQWEVVVSGGSVLAHLQLRDAEWSSKMSELGGSSGGCSIARTEERAISLQQLEAVASKVDSRCEAEAWTDIFKTKHVPSTVNLYVVAEYIIKQATEAEQCSYVETVACVTPCLPLIALSCTEAAASFEHGRARRAAQAGCSPSLTSPHHS